MKIQNLFNVANYKPLNVNNFHVGNYAKGLTKDTVSFSGAKPNVESYAIEKFRTKDEDGKFKSAVIMGMATEVKRKSEMLYTESEMEDRGSYITRHETTDGTVVIEETTKNGRTRKKSIFQDGVLRFVELEGQRGESTLMNFEYEVKDGGLSGFRMLEKAGGNNYEIVEKAEFENGVMRRHEYRTGAKKEGEPVICKVSIFDEQGNLDSYTENYKRPFAGD